MAAAQPPPPPPNLDDYSPSATLVPFDNPIPLLRGPIRASPSEDPSSGPFLLAFKDPQSWANAYNTCNTQIIQQCESGSRIGCSIAASNKCKTPWWKTILGLSKQDFTERAKCEEQEMGSCVAAAQVRCREFAKQKCFPPFRDARIATNGFHPKINWREAAKLLSWVCLERRIGGVELLVGVEIEKTWNELKAQVEVSNFRGRDLIKDSNFNVLEFRR